MATSLSNLFGNLTEGIDKINCKDCDCFLEYESVKVNLMTCKFLYESVKVNLMTCKFLSCNKDY